VPVVALALDALAVLVFAAIGRRSHAETDAATGILVTAWPFLGGLVIGWVAVLGARRRVPWTWRSAVPVWLVTVGAGMVLRHVTGKGTAPAFVVVATVFLGLTLLGWRLVARRWTKG
jgi:hypothetical protein